MTEYMWRATPYDDADDSTFSGGADVLDWHELWAEVPLIEFVEFLYRMRSLPAGDLQEFRSAIESFSSRSKTDNMLAMCNAAKAQGIVVFAIGLETPKKSSRNMEACASTPSHYYEVKALSLSNAFDSIALEVGKLRLTQ